MALQNHQMGAAMCKDDLKQTACLTLLVTTASAMSMKWVDSADHMTDGGRKNAANLADQIIRVISSVGLGQWAFKRSLTRPTFFTFLYNSGNNAASQKLRSYTIAIITPMRQARTCVWVLAPRSTPSGPKHWSQMFILRLKPCLREIATDKILKENIIESTAICSASKMRMLLCRMKLLLEKIQSNRGENMDRSHLKLQVAESYSKP